MSCHANILNGDAIVEDEILRLANRYGVKTIIETGTYRGHSTAWFATKFETVHTIELDTQCYIDAVKRFATTGNVRCHCGHSAVVLDILLSSLKDKGENDGKEMIMIYLDAHAWGRDLCPPLCAELKAIAKYFADRVVLVIDDFEVPNRTVGHNHLNYAMIKEDLGKVYPKGYYHYYIDKTRHPSGQPVGKIYITPAENAPVDFTVDDGSFSYSNLSA